MPVYPGTRPPALIDACALEREGFRETELRMFSHTGTHMDSPAHLFADGKTLDQFPADSFYGPALAVDVSAVKGRIQPEDLLPHQQALQVVQFLILYTGWEHFWGQQEYFQGFPVLSPAAARWLTQFNLKAVGVDAISVDPVEAASPLFIHKIFLGQEILLIENLCNIQPLIGRNFTLCCLPLKTRRADGAPARAVAIERV
ncbi:Kynurenine formamidase [Desulforamulus putei DSM 12395]|uniref:Kynurenine formamidase n=2 Tax=Desulforamulus putei TaxID=74701 RepID=A0A1M4Z2F7_9FIRM|nr:Kynurenine formamidase [Desulforamulus putei DSM 12395]